MRVSCLVVTSRRSRDRNAGFSAADDADVRSVVFFPFFFHSKQYFYVPQENVNLSNEQRVC